MKVFEKTRTRLLVIARDLKVRENLVMLLTGYGYYVDYVEDREQGLKSFIKYRQAVVIIDLPSFPSDSEEMMRLFMMHKKNPVIIIAAEEKDENHVLQYLKNGVYDVLYLPLTMNYVEVVLKRLVTHSELLARTEFVQTMGTLTLLVMPVWIFCAFLIAKALN
jgi:DNA-binding NtrC family response regulator